MWLLVILTFRYVQDTTGFPVYPNGTAQYYLLGDELFPAMLTELEKAEKFIFAEYFIVERGAMWDAMVEIMARKAAQGVVVRVLYDDLGSISTYAGDDVKALWKKGIQRVPFNPLIFVKGTLNYRDHRKMLIIDGRAAFSGGSAAGRTPVSVSPGRRCRTTPGCLWSFGTLLQRNHCRTSFLSRRLRPRRAAPLSERPAGGWTCGSSCRAFRTRSWCFACPTAFTPSCWMLG